MSSLRPLSLSRVYLLHLGAPLLFVAGCRERPVNRPIAHYDQATGRRDEFERLEQNPGDAQDLVILAFSGGCTRAAAFSYGVLETLRRVQITTITGHRARMLDEVDVITGVSGGSFTALAYGLYGDKLFDEDKYEKAFLKRDVQGELIK